MLDHPHVDAASQREGSAGTGMLVRKGKGGAIGLEIRGYMGDAGERVCERSRSRMVA